MIGTYPEHAKHADPDLSFRRRGCSLGKTQVRTKWRKDGPASRYLVSEIERETHTNTNTSFRELYKKKVKLAIDLTHLRIWVAQ